MKLIIALLLLVLVTAATLTAQAKPPAPAPTPASGQAPNPPVSTPLPAFSELATSRILIAYHKALEAQIQAGMAQQAAKAESDKFSAVVATEVKAAGMPAGTTANVQIATDTVTPVPPPAPAKEAEKTPVKK